LNGSKHVLFYGQHTVLNVFYCMKISRFRGRVKKTAKLK